MAKRNPGRRGRSRKRRSTQATGAQTTSQDPRSAQRTSARPSAAAERGGRGFKDPQSLGERPQAPWHPLPLSELLILVGMIGTIVGYTRGESGRAVLFAGLGAVLLGTLDFTIREHLSGYRSHSTLLASVPTALFHGAVALALFAFGVTAAALVIAPLVLDVPVFAFLYKLLRARFQDARRERTFAGGR